MKKAILKGIFYTSIISSGLFAGYNQPRTLFDMHFLNSSMSEYIEKGTVDEKAFSWNEVKDTFHAIGLTFKTQYSKTQLRDYIFMKSDRSIRKLVDLPKEHHENEQEWKKSLLFVKNKRAGVNADFTIGTGFFITDKIFITNAHVYKDDYIQEERYNHMSKNSEIYFINHDGLGSGKHHLRLFCSDMDYCLVYVPKFRDNKNFLKFKMKPELGAQTNSTLLGYPGILFRHFFKRWPKNAHETLMSSTGKGLYRLTDMIAQFPLFSQGQTGDVFDSWKGNKDMPVEYTYLDKLLIYFTPSFGGTSGGPVLNDDGEVTALNFFGSNLSTDTDEPSYGYTLGIESTWVVLDIISKCRGKNYLDQEFKEDNERKYVEFISGKFCEDFENTYLPKK